MVKSSLAYHYLFLLDVPIYHVDHVYCVPIVGIQGTCSVLQYNRFAIKFHGSIIRLQFA